MISHNALVSNCNDLVTSTQCSNIIQKYLQHRWWTVGERTSPFVLVWSVYAFVTMMILGGRTSKRFQFEPELLNNTVEATLQTHLLHFWNTTTFMPQVWLFSIPNNVFIQDTLRTRPILTIHPCFGIVRFLRASSLLLKAKVWGVGSDRNHIFCLDKWRRSKLCSVLSCCGFNISSVAVSTTLSKAWVLKVLLGLVWD